MKLNTGSIAVEVDESDIRHLMSSGTSVVATTDADVDVKIRCKGNLQFKVVDVTGEDG